MLAEDLKSKVKELKAKFEGIEQASDIPALEKRNAELKKAQEDPDLYSDLKRAEQVNRDAKAVGDKLSSLVKMKSELSALDDLVDMAAEEGDDALAEVAAEIAKLEKENLIKEKRISEMEKDRLKSDLVEKNKRLANITMSNVKRNNMLSALRREIKTLESVESLPQLKSKAARIIRQIDANMNDESDWKVSEDYFNIIYDGLLDRLKEKYPALSKTDMKICVYIKLNLSTKEIADLMNISPRSVEMARYRLRKKLGLGPNGDIASVLR